MGKVKPLPGVDLNAATISGCLKQIRRLNVSLPENHVPSTRKVWMCNIEPLHTKAVVRFIEVHMNHVDHTDFTHVKRFSKTAPGVSGDGKITISTILCAAESFTHKNELLSLLRWHFQADFDEKQLFLGVIPNELPPTKELALKWSSNIWPLSWKGNPNYQDLITAYFDVDEEVALIDQLLNYATSNSDTSDDTSMKNNYASSFISTMIAEQDPETKKIRVLHLLRDSRSEHILRHSIMNAIAQVAEAEKAKRAGCNGAGRTGKEGYLCHNLLVYTTHEPCTMCAMALVHSRIGRLIYIDTHALGAIESSHFIGDRRDLNWTFDIWRWVGPVKSTLPLLPETVAP